jgi:NAD+ kinase
MIPRKIGIIANVEKEKSYDYTTDLRKWLQERGLKVYLEDEISRKLAEKGGMELRQLAARMDLLIVFGGDGTILRAARNVCAYNVPIVGINLGGFGYLAEINLNEVYGAMEHILQGNYKTEKRMMLDVTVRHKNTESETHTVLNDVVINRGNLSRIVELETSVDDRYLTTFKADGLIVSTPTGSTAYSLSAGGPIILPEDESIIVNPICPHTLTNRPIILPAKAVTKVILWTKERGATATLDGQISFTLKSGDMIKVQRSNYITIMVSSPYRDYLEILRTKLGWGGLQTAFKRK